MRVRWLSSPTFPFLQISIQKKKSTSSIVYMSPVSRKGSPVAPLLSLLTLVTCPPLPEGRDTVTDSLAWPHVVVKGQLSNGMRVVDGQAHKLQDPHMLPQDSGREAGLKSRSKHETGFHPPHMPWKSCVTFKSRWLSSVKCSRVKWVILKAHKA